jgi:hypothetical protein
VNRQRFISASLAGAFVGTLSTRGLDRRLAHAPGQSQLGCKVTYSDGSVSEIAMKPLDPDLVRHFNASCTTQHSRTISSIQIGMFEPAFRDFGFTGLMNLDTEFRRGESLAVTYFSGNRRDVPWVVAVIKCSSGRDELLLTDWNAAYLRSASPSKMADDAWSRQQYGASRPWPTNVVGVEDDGEVALTGDDAPRST